MSKGIPISKEYGLNPSVLQCPICGKEHSIALFGAGWKDKNGKTAEAPRVLVTPDSFCDDCLKVLQAGGAFFIEVRDGEAKKNPKNPYRTGRYIAVTKQYKDRVQCHPVQYMEQAMFEEIFGETFKKEGE